MENVATCKINDKIAEITINRPKQYNSFNKTLRVELKALMDALEANETVRVAILKGAGPGFSAGADLNEPFPPPISNHLKKDYLPIFERIISSRLLYIAQVHGSAAGISAGMAMACDFLVMSDTSKISMIFSNVGLVPDGGSTWLLERALGYRKALQIIAESDHVSAEECLNFGLANKIFPAEELEVETLSWAKKLSVRAPLALSASKKLLRESPNKSFHEAFLLEALAQDAMSVSEDFHNARLAFLKKEKPVFKGK